MINAEFAAALTLDYDHIREYLREKMANYQPKRMTVAELAGKINYTKSTLDNFFDGTTKRPPFDMVCLMIVAVGGSVDEAISHKPMPVIHVDKPAAADSTVRTVMEHHMIDLKNSHEDAIDAKNETIIELRNEVCRIRELNKKLSWYHRIFVAENVLLAAIVLIDLLVPTIGWVRALVNPGRSLSRFRG